jgi:quinol monooxygenase YgiN
MEQTQYLRLFQSSVDPADIEEVRKLFVDDVVPAFTAQAGCLGIELVVNVEKNAGGLVEGAAISRWITLDAMETALAHRAVVDALVRIRQLLRQEPVSKVYEVLA